MKEDVATNTTSNFPATPYSVASTDKYSMFDVPSDVFRRFHCGRAKFERWSKFLDCSDDKQRAIYDFAKKNTKKMVVLRDETTGALRAIRRRSHNGE